MVFIYSESALVLFSRVPLPLLPPLLSATCLRPPAELIALIYDTQNALNALVEKGPRELAPSQQTLRVH